MVEGEQRRARRIMVFCNTLDSCRATEHALQEAGLPTRCYHGDVPLQVGLCRVTFDDAHCPAMLLATLFLSCITLSVS